jgi:hypothetical protein
VSWYFAWSPLNVKGLNVAIFAGGYSPSLLIVYIQSLMGWVLPNEDKELQRQRRVRGEEIDREIGISRKPAWWRRANGVYNPGEHMRDRIARNVREVGGRKPTTRNNIEGVVNGSSSPTQHQPTQGEAVEMNSIRRPMARTPVALLVPITPGNFAGARSVVAGRFGGGGANGRARQELPTPDNSAVGPLFPGANEGPEAAARRRLELMMDGPPPPPYVDRGRPHDTSDGDGIRPPRADRSASADTTGSMTAPPQQIRSMLDV